MIFAIFVVSALSAQSKWKLWHQKADSQQLHSAANVFIEIHSGGKRACHVTTATDMPLI